jgi:preprotein translocase subunit YajC
MNSNDPMFQTLTLALPMIAIFYFLIWRPQSQRQKQLRRAVDNLRRGDTVVTAGGILGKVVKAAAADEAEILVEIADNVQVKVLKATLSDVRAKGQPVTGKSADKE